MKRNTMTVSQESQGHLRNAIVTHAKLLIEYGKASMSIDQIKENYVESFSKELVLQKVPKRDAKRIAKRVVNDVVEKTIDEIQHGRI